MRTVMGWSGWSGRLFHDLAAAQGQTDDVEADQAQLDRGLTERIGRNDAVESAISNYELAFKMQAAVPDLMDLSDETEETKSLYGLDSEFAPTRFDALRSALRQGISYIQTNRVDRAVALRDR